MLEKLKMAHDELAQISVKGIDVMHMANAIMAIEQVISEMETPQENKEEENQ